METSIFKYNVNSYLLGLNLLSLKAFRRTDTELKLIAAPAIIGLSNGPPKRYKTPIATGIPNVLYKNAQKRFSLIFLIVA